MISCKWFSKGPPQGLRNAFDGLMMKSIFALVGVLVAGLLVAGAASIDGVALFEKGNYAEARQVLSAAVAEAPDNARSQFFLGRTYLALEEAALALPHLERAVRLAPNNAVYHFWLGVNYWALLDLDRELAEYDRALAIDPNLLPAHVYAGHNQLDRGQWQAALGHYIAVLQALPEHPEALYNAGVALKELGRQEEALAVWRRYLQHHRDGALAVGAARNLNLAGDFSYRAFAVGRRFVVGPSPGFPGDTLDIDPQLTEALDDIGQNLSPGDPMTLHIVTFVKDNDKLAVQRAKAVKAYISENFPDISPARVRISWFGQAETIRIGDNVYHLNESINMFTAKPDGTGF
jgi:tetratricopeptide (TPR) repeat protein